MRLQSNYLDEIIPLGEAIIKYDVLLFVGFECRFNGFLRFIGFCVNGSIDFESFAYLCGSSLLLSQLN